MNKTPQIVIGSLIVALIDLLVFIQVSIIHGIPIILSHTMSIYLHESAFVGVGCFVVIFLTIMIDIVVDDFR